MGGLSRQFSQQQLRGTAVEGDVVQGEQQVMLLIVADQVGAQQWALLEVDRQSCN